MEDRYRIGSLNSEENKIEAKTFAPDSAEWFEWLASLKAFRFVGKQGSFTARQERIVGTDKKQKGESYWYAYRKFKGHQFKRYLGANNKLALDYLEETARIIEETIKQKLGISTEGKLPNSSSSKQVTPNEKLLLRRLEKQEQEIAHLRAHIQELEAQFQLGEDSKKKALPKTDTAAPEGFTYLSDFCALHHVPYQAADDLFPRAIHGQKIKVRGRNHPVIGPKGRRDFWVQMHRRADFVSCDNCPHENMT